MEKNKKKQKKSKSKSKSKSRRRGASKSAITDLSSWPGRLFLLPRLAMSATSAAIFSEAALEAARPFLAGLGVRGLGLGLRLRFDWEVGG